MRDDNPRSGLPVVTIALIAVNTLVHVYQSLLSAPRAALFVRAAGAIPLEITTLTDIVRFPDQPPALLPIPLTIITAMFVHGGWMHLIGNMWYLWLFGDNVEDSMGRWRFLLFYVLTGLVASGVQIASDPTSIVPTVGASGAIAGVLGGYLLQFPRARVHTLLVIFIFIQVIHVPAMVILGLWFVLQVVQGLMQGNLGGVAWFAHIGGFVAGMLLIKLFVRRPRVPRDPPSGTWN
ncbi:MAG: rhomboid family intramembrane serine protease [Deltaproteobacteria bacterium]|nr:rhomboid family intramembrane serine protease [Deltaproteobacteria bacterium]